MFYFLFIFAFVLCFGDCLISSGYRLSIKSQGMQLNWCFGSIAVVLAYLITFLLITANRNGTDIINYSNIYVRETTFSDIREPIYTLLRVIFHNFGLSFYEFRAALTLAAALLPIWLIKKLEVKQTFILAFYLPSLLFLDSMQFRNAIAVYILAWAIYFLIKDNTCTWKNRMIFALCVIFAAQFHTAFIVYLVILVATLKHKKLYTQICFICSIMLLIITLLNGREVPLINAVYSLILNEGDARFYAYSSGHLIFLYPTLVHIITTVLLMYSSGNLLLESTCNSIKHKYINLIKNINIIYFAFVPFIIMNTTYYRLIRNVFLLNIIAEGAVYSLEVKKARKLLIIAGMFIISVLWLLFATQFYSSWEIIVDPVLKDGVFFWID